MVNDKSREAPLQVHVGQSFWIVIKSLICNCRINETDIKTNRGIEREYFASKTLINIDKHGPFF